MSRQAQIDLKLYDDVLKTLHDSIGTLPVKANTGLVSRLKTLGRTSK